MKQYKAIFLDWDNTIGDFSNSEILALQDIHRLFSLDRFFNDWQDYYNVYKPHNELLWEKYGRSEVTKEYLTIERFLHPMIAAGAEKQYRQERLHEMASEIASQFMHLTTKYFRLMPHAEQIVRALAKKYPLTIVSNGFVEVQYEKIERSGLAECFSHIILSEEVGIQKPDSHIFQIALDRNGLNADEVVMIGDGYVSDVVGARNAGIDQIWLTQNSSPDQTATYLISQLSELQSLL